MTSRWTEGVRREVLPNGLTLLAQSDSAAPAVAVVSHVRAGFFDEPDSLTGVSHVLEHMLFKGTPTRGVGAMARETKAAGGYLNASTSYDRTTYYSVLPPSSLATALDLQADALRRSRLDPEELRRELRVIIEEAKRKLDTPSAVAGEALHALLFDQHRIRRWRIGTEAQLAGLSHAQVLGYYRSRYVPERTIVAMAGALDCELALRTARECFAGWPAAAAAVDRSPEEPIHRRVRARTLHGDVLRADLVLGWRSVPALHPDAAALDVAALILGGGRASWLYRALRAPGVVTSVGAWHYTPTEVGVFSIAAELDPVRLGAALEGAAECLARLREAGPGADDLARARTLIRARWARRFESVEGRAGALAAAEALGGVQLIEEEFDHLLGVEAAAVRRAAEEWLRADSVSGVAYLPEGSTESLEQAGLQQAFARPGWRATAAAPVPAPALPAPKSVRGNTTADVLHVALDGADLLIRRKPGVPLVSLGAYRRRTVFDVLPTAGLAALAVRSAARGAGGLDAAALALAFERLGGTLSPAVSADWFGYSASVLAENAVTAAALLERTLLAPRFDTEEVAREQATLADESAQVADDMLRFPIQLAFRTAFGDRGYGLPAQGLPETVPALTEGMVRAWHACELAAGRSTIVAVGDVDPERLAERLAGIFGAGPPRGAADVASAGHWSDADGGGKTTVVERDKRQSAMAVLFPGPARRDAGRFSAEVWSAIAGGLGGRLFTALRDERSLAYTVLGSSWQRVGTGALLVYIATSPERESEAREALFGELSRFRDHAPSSEELAGAINYLAGQAQVHRQTAGVLAGEIAEAWLVGTGLGELADPGAGFRSVTGGAVRELAASCLDPERRVEGIVRGRVL